MRHIRSSAGFTLIELLVVMAVLGILAWAAMPMWELSARRSREAELKRSLWEIRSALDAHRKAAEEGVIEAGPSGFPVKLEELVQGKPNLKRPGERVYFLRRLPGDPFANPSLPPQATWGLRSYKSPPERPEPGADVFDVYSRSGEVGLNGIPLRDW